jgi:hypothetical protein
MKLALKKLELELHMKFQNLKNAHIEVLIIVNL